MNRGVGPTLVVCLLVGACGAEQDEALPETETDAVAVEVETEPLPFDSIPVPDYPEARRGSLVAVSAGSVDISGSWPGRAAICDSLGMLQILAEEPGRGTLILLQMPEGNRATTYPIAIVDEGPPEPPAAQIGVQILGDGGTYAFQGAEGDIHLDSLQDGKASGRIATILREITSDEPLHYVGVFSRVPVVPLSQEYCDQMASAMAPTDSATDDTP